MANIFANLGPGLAKEAKDQSLASMLFNGNAKHFRDTHIDMNAQYLNESKKLQRKGKLPKDKVLQEKPTATMKRNATDYLTARDMAENKGKALAVRHGALALAGTAAMVGPRYLSGGNMSTNNRGERDIAGIPFI